MKTFLAISGSICIVLGIGYGVDYYINIPPKIDNKLSNIVEKDPLMKEVVHRFLSYETITGCHPMADICATNYKAHQLKALLAMRDAIMAYHKCKGVYDWKIASNGGTAPIACKK